MTVTMAAGFLLGKKTMGYQTMLEKKSMNCGLMALILLSVAGMARISAVSKVVRFLTGTVLVGMCLLQTVRMVFKEVIL